SGPSWPSECAQRQVEGDVALERARLEVVAVARGEAHPQRVLVGTDLGNRAMRGVDAQLQQCVGPPLQHLLERALRSHLAAAVRGLAQQTQDDPQSLVELQQ